MKKLALAVMATSALVLGSGLVVDAVDYPIAKSVTVNPTSGLAGSTFTAKATGCVPGEIVTFGYNGASKTATCGAAALASGTAALVANGSATTTLVARAAAGASPVTASGATTGALGTADFTVIPGKTVVTQGGETNGGGTLPATGSNGTSTGLMLGFGSLLVGAGLFATARTRRNRDLSVGPIA